MGVAADGHCHYCRCSAHRFSNGLVRTSVCGIRMPPGCSPSTLMASCRHRTAVCRPSSTANYPTLLAILIPPTIGTSTILLLLCKTAYPNSCSAHACALHLLPLRIPVSLYCHLLPHQRHCLPPCMGCNLSHALPRSMAGIKNVPLQEQTWVQMRASNLQWRRLLRLYDVYMSHMYTFRLAVCVHAHKLIVAGACSCCPACSQRLIVARTSGRHLLRRSQQSLAMDRG